jgi:two-component system response regulator YesN
MQAESAEPSKALYEKCVAYVSRHYADESISVAKIAEETGVHVVHLSRVFKEYSGESLSVYINLARFEKAKELILTGMKLEQVAGDVASAAAHLYARVQKARGHHAGQYKESMGRAEVVG